MKRPRSSGFTIVEVMIVLAVTGLLFATASSLISGRTDQSEFDQSIRAIQQQVQDTVNEVSSGNYTNSGNFQCSGPGGVLTISSAPKGSVPQGTNYGCIFIGKAMQFDVNGTTPEQFLTYTLAGLQVLANGQNVTSLATSTPLAVAPGTLGTNSTIPNDTVLGQLEYGLKTVGMTYTSGAVTKTIGAVAFVYNVGSTAGSQQYELIPINSSALNTSMQTTSNAIDSTVAGSGLVGSPADPSGGVTICFASPGTSQFGILTIGGSNSSNPLGVSISVTSSIKGNPLCA